MTKKIADGESGIVFGVGSVLNLMAGKQTMTHRPINPQPEFRLAGDNLPDEWSWVHPNAYKNGRHYSFHISTDMGDDNFRQALALECPYGCVGNKLWVKEPWACCDENLWPDRQSLSMVIHKAGFPGVDPIPGGKWRPAISMPRWAARIILEIREVTAIQTKEMTTEDYVGEGCRITYPQSPAADDVALEAGFALIWDETYERKGFGYKPSLWIYRITFKSVVVLNGA